MITLYAKTICLISNRESFIRTTLKAQLEGWCSAHYYYMIFLLIVIIFVSVQLITLIEEQNGIELANKIMRYTPKYNYDWVPRDKKQEEKKMQKQDK